MIMSKKLILGVVVLVVAIVASQSFFIVRETEQVLVLQFGEPVREVREPGLEFLVPFIQNTQTYEKRILPVDPPVEQVLLSDQRRLDVDAFVRYRIINPLLFFQAVRDEQTAVARISTITNSALRSVLGNTTQTQPDLASKSSMFESDGPTCRKAQCSRSTIGCGRNVNVRRLSFEPRVRSRPN
jgi:membrane protease subunit HflC